MVQKAVEYQSKVLGLQTRSCGALSHLSPGCPNGGTWCVILFASSHHLFNRCDLSEHSRGGGGGRDPFCSQIRSVPSKIFRGIDSLVEANLSQTFYADHCDC